MQKIQPKKQVDSKGLLFKKPKMLVFSLVLVAAATLLLVFLGIKSFAGINSDSEAPTMNSTVVGNTFRLLIYDNLGLDQVRWHEMESRAEKCDVKQEPKGGLRGTIVGNSTRYTLRIEIPKKGIEICVIATDESGNSSNWKFSLRRNEENQALLPEIAPLKADSISIRHTLVDGNLITPSDLDKDDGIGVSIVTAVIRNGGDATWHNILLDVGDICDSGAFKSKRVVEGNKRYLPSETSPSFDIYRNKWLCFRVIDASTSAKRTAYAAWRIQASRPVISIFSQRTAYSNKWVGDIHSLRMQSNKPVKYRVGIIKNYPYKNVQGFSSFYTSASSKLVSSDCEYMFYDYENKITENIFDGGVRNLSGNSIQIDEYDWSRFSVKFKPNATIYCFEATDSWGNKEYIHVDNYNPIGRIRVETIAGPTLSFRTWFKGSTGFIYWDVSSLKLDKDSTACNQSDFSASKIEKISYVTRQQKDSIGAYVPYQYAYFKKIELSHLGRDAGENYCFLFETRDYFDNQKSTYVVVPAKFKL